MAEVFNFGSYVGDGDIDESPGMRGGGRSTPEQDANDLKPSRTSNRVTLVLLLILPALFACSRERLREEARTSHTQRRSSILLVTLDTTRADSIGPDARGVSTPSFNSVASRGLLFTSAYATVPETLPSHTSIMSGLYPAAHSIHENGRRVAESTELAAERLLASGYSTAAFVSGYPLDRRFGLARGFVHYDDEVDKKLSERSAAETTARALAWLEKTATDKPLFIWVHYFDPHHPYQPA